jgi:cytochrome b561
MIAIATHSMLAFALQSKMWCSWARLDEEPGIRTMHADVDTALTSPDTTRGYAISSGSGPYRAERDTALYFGLGGLVVLVGVLGLLPDSRLGGVVQSKLALHALFGLLLWGLVVVRFRRLLQSSPPAQAVDIRRFSRRLSRMIYLILYLVTGAMEVINIVGAQPDGMHPVRSLAVLEPTPGGQAFLICGLIALVWIRVLAFCSCRRLLRSIAVR